MKSRRTQKENTPAPMLQNSCCAQQTCLPAEVSQHQCQCHACVCVRALLAHQQVPTERLALRGLYTRRGGTRPPCWSNGAALGWGRCVMPCAWCKKQHTCLLLQPSQGRKSTNTHPMLDGAGPLTWLHCSRQTDGMPQNAPIHTAMRGGVGVRLSAAAAGEGARPAR
jgi:hypothetical protein